MDVYLSTILATQTSCYGQFDEVHAECVGCDLAKNCIVSSKVKSSAEASTHVARDWSPHTVSTGNYPIDLTISDIMREVIAHNVQTKTGRFTGTMLPIKWNVPITVDTTIRDRIPLTHEFKGVMSYEFNGVPSCVMSNVTVQCAEEPDPHITIEPK